jgi:lysine 2,3-aminomutase
LALRDYREIRLWSNVAAEDWTDWKWQLRNAIRTRAELEEVINLSERERKGVDTATGRLAMKITPHIATLMSAQDPEDPFRLQFVPNDRELMSDDDVTLFDDVNADAQYTPTSGLIHRYASKVLLFPSNACGSHCRYCFRRTLARDIDMFLTPQDIAAAMAYIKSRPEIEEVILSGGDPLTIDNHRLDALIRELAAIKHVAILRIHTRMPVTVPYRVDDQLIKILKRQKARFAIHVVVHIDTAEELSEPTRTALASLVDAGIPCLSSCPLLRGVNDSPRALRTLFTELVKIRVKPYYLFHSDPVRGLRHFLVPIARGLDIVSSLYDRMSGLAMPHYCFNVPGGGGHVLLGENYVREVQPGQYEITTFEGHKLLYSERLVDGELFVAADPISS